MRYIRYLMAVPLVVTLAIADVFAESADTEALKGKVDRLERELSELKDLLKKQVERDDQKEKEIEALKVRDTEKDKEIASLKEGIHKETSTTYPEIPAGGMHAEETHGEPKTLVQSSTEFGKEKLSPAFGGIYTKPFLRRVGRNTYLGGYSEFKFRQDENDDGDHGFDQARFIPFIYSDISDRVKLASELEFEHGGISDENEGEVIIEFATVDFLLTDWINFRSGLILQPLGKYNLVHDAPLQDFTDRPLVDQFIIPTTLTDAGMGFFGTTYPSELSKLDYEIYVTNGVLHGLDADGTSHFSLNKGIRDTKDGFELDNYNQSPAVVGRVTFSPFIGLEFGTSAYTLRYDENNNNQMTISAFDMAYQRGPFEFVAEGAYAFIETDDFARNAGVADSMWGYYTEARYHFMPPALKSWAPKFFTENSTFTGVVRWEQVQTSALEAGSRVDWLRTRITPGLNYRYTEDTVFKLDYQINVEQKDMPDLANNAFLFSVATYF